MNRLARLGARSARVFQRWLPDPFVFALGLTLLTAVAAMAWMNAGPAEVVSGWYEGFWRLLEFGMQMVLILATGYAIALAPPAARLIDRLAGRLATPGAVYLVVLGVGGLLALVSWGWVAITAVLGRELATRVRGVDYPFLVACVYLSSQTWVMGLSSSIPLLLNTPGNFLIEAGLLPGTIPVAETLGSPLNLAALAVVVVGSVVTVWLTRPRGRVVEIGALAFGREAVEPPTVAEEAAELAPGGAPSDRMNRSATLQAAVAAMGLGYLALHFARRGLDLNLNVMIFLFLVIGLLLHRTPIRYVAAMRRATSNISGIVFQYPFYAGIMGIMTATGLGAALASWMAARVGLELLPLAAFGLGAAVNFAIPSAGGEWAVLGPPLVEAVRDLVGPDGGAELAHRVARVAMAVAYGETLTNLLQPFFLLAVVPVMGAGLKIQARDLMGWVFVPFLVIFTAVGLLVALFP